MSDPLNKESSGNAQESAPCPRCLKPFAKELKFTVSSWFQTDPGDGLSRWQECCKCGIEEEAVDDDLPFSQSLSGSQRSLNFDDHAPMYDFRAQHTAGSQLAQPSSDEPETDDRMQDRSGVNSTLSADSSDARKWADRGAAKDSGNNLGSSSNAPQVVSLADEGPPASNAVTDAHSVSNNKSGDGDDKSVGLFLNSGDFSEAPEQPPESKDPNASAAESSGEEKKQLPTDGTKYDGRNIVYPMKPTYLPQATRDSPSQSTPAPWGPPSQTYMIGGRYEVDSVIGKGTFGPTYRARDVATGKLMCLKMVSTPISRHRRVIKRILQEVEKCKTLNHPYIVAIYDSAVDKSGRPFYVMDLVEQGSLKQAIRQEGFLDVTEVLDIFLDVCEALTYAHEQGILHRDLKPSNILLTGAEHSRRAKVADFGIIKALPSVGSEALEMTQSTDVFADPTCMSPEQCLGKRLDVRSDIYSLGCSMYEAIIGKRVFTGPNPLSVVVQHFKATPRSFDSVMYNCDIHEDVEAVVMRMLEKSPDNRYQEISQVVEDLRLLKARKKPNFAYQKKKVVRSLMLPFGVKDEPNSAEKLFDIVLHNKNGWNDKQAWADDPKPKIAADIERLANKPKEIGRRQRMRVVAEGNEQSDVIAENAENEENDNREVKRVAQQERRPIKQSSPDEVWAGPPMQNNQNSLKLPSAPIPQRSDPQPQRAKAMMPVYRSVSDDQYYNSSVSLFGHEDEDDMPIVTVEQAKREIPDYLLQISQSTGSIFSSWPVILAIIIVFAFFMCLMILTQGHPSYGQ